MAYKYTPSKVKLITDEQLNRLTAPTPKSTSELLGVDKVVSTMPKLAYTQPPKKDFTKPIVQQNMTDYMQNPQQVLENARKFEEQKKIAEQKAEVERMQQATIGVPKKVEGLTGLVKNTYEGIQNIPLLGGYARYGLGAATSIKDMAVGLNDVSKAIDPFYQARKYLDPVGTAKLDNPEIPDALKQLEGSYKTSVMNEPKLNIGTNLSLGMSDVGSMAAYAIPGTFAEKGISKLPLISKIASPTLRGIVSGAVSDATLGALEGKGKGETPEQILQRALTNAAMGAGFRGLHAGVTTGLNKMKITPDDVRFQSNPEGYKLPPIETRNQNYITKPDVSMMPRTVVPEIEKQFGQLQLPPANRLMLNEGKSVIPMPPPELKLGSIEGKYKIKGEVKSETINNSIDEIIPDYTAKKQNFVERHKAIDVPMTPKLIDDYISEFDSILANERTSKLATMKSEMGKGVDRVPIYDAQGDTGKMYRVSNNPEWYSQHYKEYGKKPTMQNLENIADRELMKDKRFQNILQEKKMLESLKSDLFGGKIADITEPQAVRGIINQDKIAQKLRIQNEAQRNLNIPKETPQNYNVSEKYKRETPKIFTPGEVEAIKNPAKFETPIEPKQTTPSFEEIYKTISGKEPPAPRSSIKTKSEPIVKPQSKTVHSESLQNDLNKLEFEYQTNVTNTKKNPLSDSVMQSKKLKGMAMVHSAKKRALIQGESLIPIEGGLTATELSNKIKYLNTNYKGKRVVTPNGEGEVVGNSFGKIGVKHADGTITHYPSEQIRPLQSVDEIIASQRRAQPKPQPIQEALQAQPKQTTTATLEIPSAKVERPQQAPKPEPQQRVVAENATSSNIPPLPPRTKVRSPEFAPTGKTKQSKLKTNSIKNAEWMQSDEGKAFVEDLDLGYNVTNHVAGTKNAVEMLEKDYEGTVKRMMENGIDNSDADVIAAGQIARDLEAKGDWEGLKLFAKKAQPEITKMGQAIEALKTWKPKSLVHIILKGQKMVAVAEKMLKETNPESYTKATSEVKRVTNEIDKIIKNNDYKVDLQMFAEKIKLPKNYVAKIQKMVESGKYTKDELTELLKEKYNLPSLTTADLETMAKHFNDAENAVKGSWEQRSSLDKLHKVVPNKLPNSLADYVRAWQMMNLFGNTKTIAKIGVGNVVGLSLHNAKEVAKTIIDLPMSVVTKQKTATFPSLKTQVKGIAKGVRESYKDWKHGVDTNPFENQFEYVSGRVFKNKVLNRAHETVKSALTIFERPFKQGIYDDILRQEMKIGKVSEATQEMKDYALQEAEKIMYHNENVATTGLKKLRGNINEVGNKGIEHLTGIKSAEPDKFGLGNVVMPVLKTPTNMAIMALEYTPPVGLIRGVVQLAKNGAKGQKSAADAFAKGVTGGLLGWAGYEGAKRGLAYGGSDKDKDVNDSNKENGKQPYSVNIGGKNITYDWMQPASTIFSFGAELGQTNKNKDPLTAAGNSVFNQSMLQSLNRIMGGSGNGSNPTENLKNTMLSSTSQFVPFGGLLNQVSKQIDPLQRDTGSDPLKATLNRTPFKMLLPPKITKQGNTLERDSFMNNWINPSLTKDINQSNVPKELSRLYEESGQKTQFPVIAPDSVTRRKEKIPFTKAEIQDLQVKIGKQTMEDFNEIVDSSRYKGAPNDEEKAKILAQQIERIKEKYIREILNNR